MELYFIILLPVAVALWLGYEWIEHTFVKYTTTNVECQYFMKNTEFRICIISDLHNNHKNLSKLVEQLRRFSPDVILLPGDLVNKHKTENTQAVNFLTVLARLKKTIYYSVGNHEEELRTKEPEAWKRYLDEISDKVIFLDNEGVYDSEKPEVYISGLSLPEVYYKKGKLYHSTDELPGLNIPEHCFHILLAHNPEYVKLYQKYHADLIVSGHLHGGLLRLPFLGGIVSPRLRLPEGCDAGLAKTEDNKYLFVSRGLGSHTIPLRFFNRVEVNFLLLKGVGSQTTESIKEME